MKQLLIIRSFNFISTSIIAQTDSVINGQYTFIEQKGIHGQPGMRIGDSLGTPCISHADTTFTLIAIGKES